jgi:hypothetical protein
MPMARQAKPKTPSSKLAARAVVQAAPDAAASDEPTKVRSVEKDAARSAQRKRWLDDLGIEFRQWGEAPTSLADVLRHYHNVGMREICAAIPEYNLLNAVTWFVNKSYCSDLEKDVDSDRQIGPLIVAEEALIEARKAQQSDINIGAKDGVWRPRKDYCFGPRWDLDFALRSKVIPSHNGVLSILGQPDPRVCWRELMKLAQSEKEKMLSRNDIDQALRNAYEASNPLALEMPPSFKIVVGVLHSQFNTLFRGLAIELVSSNGVHPATKKRETIEARTWDRANIALDLRTGDLINQRTGEVEWYDIRLSSQPSAAIEATFVVQSTGGRRKNVAWCRRPAARN